MFGSNDDDKKNNNQNNDNNGFDAPMSEGPLPAGSIGNDSFGPPKGHSAHQGGTKPQDSSAPVVTPNNPTIGNADDLLNIKQNALQELSPLINHLDQTPEEKFKTTMMMIQASDDQSMVKSAFETAKQIKDDKLRAQALLDIINEINYFTQQHES